ncbi:MAG: chorismate synthase [SAR202 cluster bacterium]|nr:MAG: chorismate synthase [SAR202 cluster bacterium]|tara:strand:- start:1006 stop:2085 length:1080 start_codon:yes stop_codon:yes gene_type:complete
MGNIFGQAFKITTWGESHGDAVGVIIDGCPPGIEITAEEIQADLNRRKPGQSEISTQRKEGDQAEITSGIFDGQTLGTPISIIVWNTDAKGKDYEHMKDVFRPSHADYTYQAKYGIRNWKGGGRSSARETIGRVAAGAIAKKILKQMFNTDIFAYVSRIHNISSEEFTHELTSVEIESNIVRCPDPIAAEKMINAIKSARKNGDSLGGIVNSVIYRAPVGLGEPVFDKLEADLAKGILSIPACKGFEIGSGFDGTFLTGSQHNDQFYIDNGNIRTHTNNSGGIQGGISNGENITISAAFKPTATIMKSQKTVDIFGNEVELQGRGRHDPCVLPRAVPIVEAMISLVLIDHALRHRGQIN